MSRYIRRVWGSSTNDIVCVFIIRALLATDKEVVSVVLGYTTGSIYIGSIKIWFNKSSNYRNRFDVKCQICGKYQIFSDMELALDFIELHDTGCD